jgi:dihydroorotase
VPCEPATAQRARSRQPCAAALADGIIDAICSDHQPHDRDAKLAPFAATEPGISALETLLALTLRLVSEGLIDLPRAIAALTSEPARILDIDAGHLGIGAVADLCIIDPAASWRVEESALVSAGKNTPFGGWEMTGQVSHTLLGGEIVFQRQP